MKLLRNAVLLTLFLSSYLHAQESKLPNVVILYADDMGVADVSYGDPAAKIQTPNIDRLAKQGMTFSDGHSSSGICTPSRFALLTGQHHWRRFHGIVNAFGTSVFEEGEFTIARMFKQQGYQTGCFGKWHLGWDWDAIRKPDVAKDKITLAESYDWTKRFPGGPVDQGFDYYFGDGTINFPPYCWIENDRFLTIPTKPVIKSKPLAGGGGFRAGPMAADWNPYDILPTVSQKAVEWIEKQDGEQPFFVYLAFNSPHYPIVPNKEFQGTSQAGYYGDFVIETDAMVGKVLAALEKKGVADNTLVIFTADNGTETHAFKRLEEFGQWSSGDFRGVKRDTYEGGHRVPFIAKWPGKIEAGSRSEEVVSQVDFAATFADIVGYQLGDDEGIDSYDLMPVLTGADYEQPLRVATVQNTSEQAGYALRQGDWVYLNRSTGAAQKEKAFYLKHFGLTVFPKDSPGLLFNLREDPRQSKDLFDQYPEKVEAMNKLLERYLGGERCAPERLKSDPEAAKMIRKLAPAAAAMENEDFIKLLTTGQAVNVTSVENQPLSLVVLSAMALDLPEETYEDRNAEFSFSSLTPNPNKLVKLLCPGLTETDAVGLCTMLHPQYITEVTCDAGDDSATGVITFDAGIYAGQVNYAATKADGNWQINQFSFPTRDWRFVRTEDGNWQWFDHFGLIESDRELPTQDVEAVVTIDGMPVSGRLTFWMTDYPEFNFDARGDGGKFMVPLPAGKYTLTTNSSEVQNEKYSRLSTSDLIIEIAEGQSKVEIELSSK